MEIHGRVVGKEHPDYATCLNSLAVLYYSMADYANAELLHVEAREIRRRVLGEEHPHYAASLNNLAAVYESMGDYARAAPLYLQAMEVRKRVLGDEHPKYASSLSNLAGLYYSLGEYAKAEPLYVQALEIRKRVLGDKHPVYAWSLNNLAFLYIAMEEYAKAEPLLMQALGIKLNFARNILPWVPEAQAMNFVRKQQAGRDPLLSVLRKLPWTDHRQVYSAVWETRSLVTRSLVGQRKVCAARRRPRRSTNSYARQDDNWHNWRWPFQSLSNESGVKRD
jgi:tetratricopeptide (TPR) repeat protein